MQVPRYYSAKFFADVLQEQVRCIRRELAHLTPASTEPSEQSNGQKTRLYALATLPQSLRTRLEKRASEQKYRSVEEMLERWSEPWQAPIPAKDISAKHRNIGFKRLAAFAPSVARAEDESLSPGEFVRLGMEDYRRVMEQPHFTARRWRQLWRRTRSRVRSTADWQRCEVYLDDSAFERHVPSTIGTKAADLLPLHAEALKDEFDDMDNRAEPTLRDQMFIFDAACRHFERTVAEHQSTYTESEVKRSLLDFLFTSLRNLAKSRESLRKRFERAIAIWREKGKCPSALKDQRALKSGRRRPDFSADDTKIAQLASVNGRNESLAHRELRLNGQLSEAYTDHYNTFDVRGDKSRVPQATRDAITPLVEMCAPEHRGPKEARMRGPYIQRDWSGVNPGDWFCADDVTWNHYAYDYDEKGELVVTRAECLLFTDLRSGYGLRFCMIVGKYTGQHIVNLFTRVHERHGLSHAGLLFERGIWASRRVVGEKSERNLIRWRDTAAGLREKGLGLEVRHATTPRAKPIEGLLRILQERMRTRPGFVGFNERTEKMERMQKFLARCRSGAADPREELLSVAEWTKEISSIIAEFNNEPFGNRARMLPGQSPFEAWNEAQNTRPLRKLSPEELYIICDYRQVATVQQGYVEITVRGTKFEYVSDQFLKRGLFGKEVLTFHNSETPKLLLVSDMNRQNFFVATNPSLPAMSATQEQQREVNRMIADARKPAKVYYDAIPHKVTCTITRDNAIPETAKELGRFRNEQVEAHKAEKRTQARRVSRVKQLAGGIKMELPKALVNDPRALSETEALLRDIADNPESERTTDLT